MMKETPVFHRPQSESKVIRQLNNNFKEREEALEEGIKGYEIVNGQIKKMEMVSKSQTKSQDFGKVNLSFGN